MTPREHPLFTAHPLSGTTRVSTGELPVPYHVYDGHGLLVGGTCDIANAFDGQDVYPVHNASGQGLAVLFVCDFTGASHGAHREIHFAALAAPAPGQILPDDPAALLAAFAMQPDWGILSLHLWNDDPGVVAYNREFLGLDAHLCAGDFSLDPGRVRFGFEDETGALLSGDVGFPRFSDAGMMFALMRHMGLRGMIAAARQPHAVAHVFNRKSTPQDQNLRARTLTAPDKMVVTRFRPARDHITLSSPLLSPYGFQAHCLEHISPFRFVYFPPDPDA